MTVRFVIGPPGSGKTSWCMDRVRAAVSDSPLGAPIVLLVPEQMSYITEHALLSHELRGTVRARVFSFKRLAQWIFSQSPDTRKPHLADIHRRVIVTMIVARMRHAGGDGILGVQSIERAVADFVAEMKQCRATPAALHEIAAALPANEPHLARKLRDLARVATEYDAAIRDRFEEPEETMASLCDTIATLDALQGAEIYVDGFYGFTPVEMEILRGLVRRCRSVTFTLAIDKFRFDALRTGDKPSIFSRAFLVEETVPSLLGLAAENAKIDEVVTLPQRDQPSHFQSQAISHLQKYFLTTQRAPACEDARGVELHTVSNPRAEARRAVETLLEWRDKHGWQWGDMAIIARDLETYAQPLGEYLRQARIPFFLDRNEPLETHPLVQGTIAALESVLDNWQTETILEFAKSGLFDFDRDNVSRLQQFVRSYPQSPARWTSANDWAEPPARSPFEDEPARHAPQRDMREINATRRTIMQPLKQLSMALAVERDELGQFSVAAFVKSLCDFLASSLAAANEKNQAVMLEIGELLDGILAAAGDVRLHGDVLADLVRESFSALTLPRIPPLLDQITVAQIDRSRLARIKGAVVVGLAEGCFPNPGSNATLLTDRERDQLWQLSAQGNVRVPEFRASGRRRYLREGFFAWMAFTRASHALALVRPLSDEAGQKLAPSTYWDEVLRIVPSATIHNSTDAIVLSNAMDASEAAAVVCRDLFQTCEPGIIPPTAAFDVLCRTLPPAQQSLFHRVILSAGRRNQAQLDAELAREVFGNTLRTSVSALESHSACPFQYFMRTVIAPEVADSPVISNGDLGNLVHAVMKDITDQLIARQASFADLDADAVPGIVEIAFQKPLERLGRSNLFETAKENVSVDLLKKHVVELVRFLGDAAGQLKSRPIQTEMAFGRTNSPAALNLELASEQGQAISISVRGQIDRIDLVQCGDELRLAVFDYKLSERKPDWAQLANGNSLQLPVYLLVLDRNRSTLCTDSVAAPAGAFYIPIIWSFDQKRCLRGILPHDVWQELGLDAYDKSERILTSASDPHVNTATRGDVIGPNQFDSLSEGAERHIKRIVGQIISGEIAVSPAWIHKTTPCGYCPYNAACRLDYSMNHRRSIPTLPRASAIETWLGKP